MMFLVFFSCANHNPIMWSICVESPLILALQYYLYQIQSEMSIQKYGCESWDADERA